MELGKKQIVQDVPVKERDVDADVEFLDAVKDYIARTKNPRVLKYVKRCKKEISLAGLLEAVSGQNRYYYSDGDLELFHATVTRCCIASGWIQLWMEIIFSAENINMLRLDTVEYLLSSWELLRAIYVSKLLHAISVRYYDLFLDELDAPIEEWPLRRHFAKLARQNYTAESDIIDKFAPPKFYAQPKSTRVGSYSLDLLGKVSSSKPFVDIEVDELAKKIEELFRANDVNIEIASATINPTTTVFEIEKMPRITKKLLAHCDFELCALLLKFNSAPRLEYVGDKLRIYVQNYCENSATIADVALSDSRRPLCVPIGRSAKNHYAELDFASDGHLLYCNYSDNADFATNLALSLMWKNRPDDARFVFLEPNRYFANSPYLLFENDDELSADDAVGMLKALRKESVRRAADSSEHSPIFVFIEDFDDLAARSDFEKLCQIVNDIAADWRVNNIHFVIRYRGSDEHPRLEPLKGIERAAMCQTNCASAQYLIGNIDCGRLLIDEAYFNRAGSTELITVYDFDERHTANICDYLCSYDAPKYWDYTPTMLSATPPEEDIMTAAIRVVCEAKRARTSLLQRRLHVGYGKAASIIDELADAGIVGDFNPESGERGRKVLVTGADEAIEKYREYRNKD